MSAVRTRRWVARVVCFLLIGVACWPDTAAASSPHASLQNVEANDNRRAAGTLDRGTLTAGAARRDRALAARRTGESQRWRSKPSEKSAKTLTVPAPLIRVAEGTADRCVDPERSRGRVDRSWPLHARRAACAPLEVPPGQTREVRFTSGPAGTYHYWASTIGAPVPFRELAGAFVVDGTADRAEPDRIMVITEWTNLTARQLGDIVTADDPTEVFVRLKPRLTFVINGLSWPATERFAYELGQTVRWRVINLSSQAHPLHLHGFYFEVNSLGNGLRDSPFDDAHRRRVVTQLLPSGGTMAMTWTPERAGNWLFHCHIMHHVSLDRRLADGSGHAHPGAHHSAGAHAEHENTGDLSNGYGRDGDRRHRARSGAGVGVGISADSCVTTQVDARHAASAWSARRLAGRWIRAERRLVHRQPRRPPRRRVLAIVLRRDEPVEITLVNHLADATAIHWHGIELDSYYDGVHGWSGHGRRVTPMIEPGGSFVVRFTPPRAGTFIYHTHLHDYRQLSSGLYGPLIVTDSNETFDPATDHVIVLGRSGLTSEDPSVLTDPESVVMNGRTRSAARLEGGSNGIGCG